MKRKHKLILGTMLMLSSASVIEVNAQSWNRGGNTGAGSNIFGFNDNQSVDIRTNGINRMFISSGGNIGIGTLAPAFLFDVVGSGNASMSFKSTDNTANLILDRGNAGNTAGVNYRLLGNPQWQTGCINTDNYVIRNVNLGSAAVFCSFTTNNVGIGTTSPTERLQVNGNILASGNVAATNVTATGTVSGATITSTGNVNAVNFTGSGNIDVAGHVGFGSIEEFTDGGSSTIASNSSIVPLTDCGIGSLGSATNRWNNIFACGDVHIGTTTAVTAQLSVAHTTLSGIGGVGSFQIGENTTANLVMDNNEVQARSNGLASTLFLQFNGGNIDANFGGGNALFHGNVGIGTTAPTRKLHIVRSSSGVTPLVNAGIVLEANTANFINVLASAGLETGVAFGNPDNAADGGIYYSGAALKTLDFRTDGNLTRMRIDSTGKVGINTSVLTEALNVAGSVDVTSDLYTGTGNGVINAGGGTMNVNINIIGDADNHVVVDGDEDLFIDDQLEVRGVASKTGGGVWTAISDARLKKDVKPYSDGLSQLLKVKPVVFKYNDVLKLKDKDKEYVGVIAQEMQQVAPYMIQEQDFFKKAHEDENGNVVIDDPGQKYLTYDGTALTYMLVNAVKEQQQQIEVKSTQLDEVNAKVVKLEEMVSKLDNALAQCCSNYNEKSAAGLPTDAARLEQNAPNPFSQSTVIKFYIPQNFKSAQVKIYSSLGDAMKVFHIAAAGVGQVEISANTMVAGIYNYTLIIDGKAIDSKQMIMTK